MSAEANHRGGDRYTLREDLGEGGFGRVYVAVDRVLNREVALKELSVNRSDCADSRRRLLREVQITGQLEHPGIVPVYDLAAADDARPFYTMRLIRGQKLSDAIAAFHARRRRGEVDPLTLPRLLNALIGICNAIGFAHARGVMHRDLKPDNVVLGEFGEVVLLDWGVAKVIGEDEEQGVRISADADVHKTAADGAVGTPAYMAPEQARGTPGLRTDVHGLGAILFELLTGRPPHEGADSAEVLQQILSGPTPRAKDQVAEVPAALDAICARAMARDPEDRYGSPAEVADDLQRYLADQPVRAHREAWTAVAARWMRRHRAWTLAAAAVALITILITSIAAVRLAHSTRREREARIATEGKREQAVRAAAKFAARTVAGEIDLRWRILEAEAKSGLLRQGLQDLLASEDVVAAPARARLQGWLEGRHRANQATAAAASWFLTDGRGRHVGRSPLDEKILGRDFSFRDYFHGLGRDLPAHTVEATANGALAAPPIEDVHKSVVFESQASHELIVAFSVPVWSVEDGASRRVLGVLAMTVELGRFAALQVELSDEQIAVLVETETDWLEGSERRGLVLHHPQLARGQVCRLDAEEVAALHVLRAAELDRRRDERAFADGPLGARRAPLPGSLQRGYLDPVEGEGGQPWLAALEPVLINGRPEAQRDTGWVVLVQERAAAMPR